MGAPTVVIADDQASFRRSATAVLTARGYRVLQAADGVQALALCRTEQPDVILLDIVMPDMDGVTMCKALREDTSLPYIPIIYYSRRERVEDRVAALRAGGDDFVGKDIDDEELVARIEVGVRIRRLVAGAPSQRRPATDAPDLAASIASAFRRAEKASEPLSLLMVEVPAGNDGVSTGDLLELLTSCCRGDDVVGTEKDGAAVAILAGTHFGGALATAERLWKQMPPQGTFAGIHIGVACYPNREVSSAKELISFARAALERAKSEGPAHICLYQHQAYLFRPD